MLKGIVEFFLGFRGGVVALACVVVAYGLFVAVHAKLKFRLLSDTLSPMAVRTFADWTVRPRLLAVPGVAKVTVFGGEVRQLQIQARPDRLLAFDLALQDVLNAAREATGVRGAGFIETAAQRILIQTEGQSLTALQLGEVVVAQHDGRSVRLKDVANVVEAPEPKI